jgi:hypothetical protein
LVLGAASFNALSAGGPPQVRLAGGIGQLGEKMDAELRVDSMPVPGLGFWTIDVAFDPLLLVNSCMATQQGGTAFCRVNDDAHSVHLVGANNQGIVGDDVLARISLQCSKEYSLTSSVVTVDVLADATASEPQGIEADVLSGQIVCAREGQRGDVDCDGLATSVDAAIILQATAGLTDLLACAHGDANFDHITNSLDAVLILQYTAGLIDHFG